MEAPGQVPDALTPPPHHPRFPLMDGMRAIAALSVLVVHVAIFAEPSSVPFPGLALHLNIGVTIFFLISGFLLYRPFIAHRAGGGAAPAIPRYARRRALRILPAYWLVLTVLTIVPGTVGVSGGDWLTQYALLHALPLTDAAEACYPSFECGLAQTWSLSVEMSFYALLPLWFLLSERFARGRTQRQWVTVELAALAALSAASALLPELLSPGNLVQVIYGTAAGYVFWFALGMGLAIGSVMLAGKRLPPWLAAVASRPLIPWAAAAALYAVIAATLPTSPFLLGSGEQISAHVAFGLIAFLLMVPAVFGEGGGGAPRSLLGNPVVAWLGLVSYGIFLWHYVVAYELGIGGGDLSFWPLLGATVAISILVAAISYYLVERPLLRFK